MIDKLCAVKTSEGARKKRQREINRDETRTSGLTDEAVEECIAGAREDCARGETYGVLWVAGSSSLLVSSSRASIGPLCHCQYSKEVQIIW